MITGKAPSEVRIAQAQNRPIVDEHRCTTAAFLTQTVTLDDQTTVKFEIWYSHPSRNCFVVF